MASTLGRSTVETGCTTSIVALIVVILVILATRATRGYPGYPGFAGYAPLPLGATDVTISKRV